MGKKGDVAVVTRFQRVMQCINETKGISEKIEEAKGIKIHNWSPNNVRRLFLGPDFVGVQKYVASGSKNKFELYKINRVDDSKPCSVLKLLTSGRVLSSIEEILIFQEVGKVLYDVEGVWGNTSFVRLGIFMVYEGDSGAFSGPPEYLKLSGENLEYCASFHRMFSHEFKKYGFSKMMGFKPNYAMLRSSKSYLRGTYYGLDAEGGALRNYFTTLAEKEKEFINAAKNEVLSMKNLEYMYVGILRTMASKPAEKYYATITPYLIDVEGIGEYVPYMTIPIGRGGTEALCKAIDGVTDDGRYESAFSKKWETMVNSDKLAYLVRQIKTLYEEFDKSIESFLIITYSKDSEKSVSVLKEVWASIGNKIVTVYNSLGSRTAAGGTIGGKSVQESAILLLEALMKMKEIVYPNCD